MSQEASVFLTYEQFQKLSSYQTFYNEGTDKINQLLQQVKDSQKQVESLKLKQDVLQQDLSQSVKANNKLRMECQSQEKTIKELSKLNESQRGVVESYQKKVSELEKTVKTKNEETKQLKEKLAKQLHSGKDSRKELMEDYERKVSELEKLLEMKKMQSKQLKQKSSKLIQLIENLQRVVKTNENQLNSQNIEQQHTVKQLQNANEKLSTELDKLNKKLDTMKNAEQHQKRLSAQNDEFQKQAHMIKSKLLKMTQQNSQMAEKLRLNEQTSLKKVKVLEQVIKQSNDRHGKYTQQLQHKIKNLEQSAKPSGKSKQMQDRIKQLECKMEIILTNKEEYTRLYLYKMKEELMKGDVKQVKEIMTHEIQSFREFLQSIKL